MTVVVSPAKKGKAPQTPHPKEPKKNSYLYKLAMNFELFFWSKQPFMTHMYSSGIFYYQTPESGNLKEWLSAILEIEEILS